MDLQKAVQQVLDRAVENGTECGCQAALYIDGELAVNAYAGWTDWSRTQKVDENTVFPVYSTGKAMSSTVIHRLVEMGKVNYDTKIADFWPEFGCNGKEDMRVWHVLAYRAALSSIPETEIIPQLLEEGCDEKLIREHDELVTNFKEMIRRIAKAAPNEPFGGKQVYHPFTYGWLTGGIAMHVTGTDDYPALFKELVGEPAGMDRFFYGISPDENNAAHLVKSLDGVTTTEYGVKNMNNPLYRQCCNPASCAMSNALSLARHYAALDRGTLLTQETIDNAVNIKWRAKDDVIQAVRGRWALFGLGYVLSGPVGDFARIFGHGGLGGSEALLDRKRHYALGFTRNCFANPSVLEKFYEAIDFKNRDWPDPMEVPETVK